MLELGFGKEPVALACKAGGGLLAPTLTGATAARSQLKELVKALATFWEWEGLFLSSCCRPRAPFEVVTILRVRPIFEVVGAENSFL